MNYLSREVILFSSDAIKLLISPTSPLAPTHGASKRAPRSALTHDLENSPTIAKKPQPQVLNTAIMSDNDEVEVESPSGYQVLPKDVLQEIGTTKLFNKWSYEDVEVRDISLT